MDFSHSSERVLTPVAETAAAPASGTHINVSDIKSAANEALQDAKVKFDELAKVGHQYIKENPGKSVLAALGLGFVVGLILKD